jgi:predicted nucleic acid-binding protein
MLLMPTPVKQAKAMELFDRLVLQPADTVLIWQVAAEFLSQLRRWESKGKLTPDEVQATFRRFSAMFPLQAPSAGIFQLSFDLRSRFSLSHWDSLLLAACKEAGVTTLYSEDMDSGTDYETSRPTPPRRSRQSWVAGAEPDATPRIHGLGRQGFLAVSPSHPGSAANLGIR